MKNEFAAVDSVGASCAGRCYACEFIDAPRGSSRNKGMPERVRHGTHQSLRGSCRRARAGALGEI